jgi:hypothetical protein
MSAILSLLPKVAPLAVRHLAAYMELAATDAAVLARSLTRRLIAAAVALLGGLFTVLMGCVWIVTAVWDTPWRDTTLGALLVLFAAVTFAAAVLAARRWPAGREPFARLRGEWDSDKSLIRELSEPLAQTRQELRELLADQDVRRLPGEFPRSATLRFLLGGTGAPVMGAILGAAAIGMLPRAGKWLRFIPLTSVARWLFQRTPAAVGTRRMS